MDRPNGAVHGGLQLPDEAMVVVDTRSFHAVVERILVLETEVTIGLLFITDDPAAAFLFEHPLRAVSVKAPSRSSNRGSPADCRVREA